MFFSGEASFLLDGEVFVGVSLKVVGSQAL